MNTTTLSLVQNRLDTYKAKPWAYGRATPHKAEEDDKYMSLSLEAQSGSAGALTADLLPSALKAANKQKATYKLSIAMDAVIGELLQAASKAVDLFSYRPMGKAEFDGMRIGHGPAKTVLDGLTALGLVDHEAGFKCGVDRNAPGQATRVRARTSLLEVAFAHGITPGNWSSHYRYAPPPAKVAHPIIVRGKREYWHKADNGPKLKPDKANPAYIAAAKQVQAINTYMARQAIGGCPHQGFRRIFNYGDQPGFDHNMGGRLYAIGGGYQSMPSKERADITINGEATVEIDVRASHLSIIYALAGAPLDSAADPYAMAWPPRDVAKAWVTMILGYGKFQTRWSPETKERLAEKGFNLDDYPIDDVRAAVLDRHPVLADWPESNIGWPQLQYQESCAIINAVSRLAFVHDVPSLPVHDSLIVPVSRLSLAKRTLEDAFRQQIGITPVFTTKLRGNTTVL